MKFITLKDIFEEIHLTNISHIVDFLIIEEDKAQHLNEKLIKVELINGHYFVKYTDNLWDYIQSFNWKI